MTDEQLTPAAIGLPETLWLGYVGNGVLSGGSPTEDETRMLVPNATHYVEMQIVRVIDHG